MAQADAAPASAPGRKMDLVTIAYYFGAFMVLFAYTVFMGLQWESLGRTGQLFVSSLTFAVLLAIGAGLRRFGFGTPGTLLVFAAVGITPLVAYSIENVLGVWPSGQSPFSYHGYYLYVAPPFVYMEIASIATAALAAWLTRFPLNGLLVGFWVWFLSMDLARWLGKSEDWTFGDRERVVSVAVGVLLLGVGVALQVSIRRDYAWWLYLSGHVILIGNLASLAFQHEGWAALAFLAFYVGIVVASVWLQRRVFLVFGALGVYGYISYLAFRVFEGTLGFVFALASVGLLIIFGAIAYRRFIEPLLMRRISRLRPAAARG